MFLSVALCPHDGADFLAGIAGIKIVEQVAERGKIVATFIAIYTVIDCDITNVTLGKETFGVVADFQIGDNCFDLSCFRKAYHLIPARPVE